MKDLISIIVPVYNSELTIEETLLSIKKQKYANIELIIVNDGSKDNSKKLIENFINNNNSLNIKLFNINNIGVALARNYGVNKSNGKYVVFIDSDDLLHEDYVELAYSEFLKNNELCLVYSDVEFFGAKSGLWKLREFSIRNMLINNCIPIFAMFKKEDFINLNGFDKNLNFAEDWELWLRMIKINSNVCKINRTLYYYRQSENETSLTNMAITNKNIDYSRLYIFNKHYEFYFENKLNLTELINYSIKFNVLKNKYDSIWYRKLFKKLFK